MPKNLLEQIGDGGAIMGNMVAEARVVGEHVERCVQIAGIVQIAAEVVIAVAICHQEPPISGGV